MYSKHAEDITCLVKGIEKIKTNSYIFFMQDFRQSVKIQMFQNTNRTIYNKKFKIQTRQNTKEQNTNATKYQWDKIQIEQNTKIPKYKITKYKLLKYKRNKIQLQQNTD